MKLGYLGPKGTFSEQAALLCAKQCGGDCEFEMFFNITDVISAVDEGRVDMGVVPLENSIEGTVTRLYLTPSFLSGMILFLR